MNNRARFTIRLEMITPNGWQEIRDSSPMFFDDKAEAEVALKEILIRTAYRGGIVESDEIDNGIAISSGDRGGNHSSI